MFAIIMDTHGYKLKFAGMKRKCFKYYR